MATHSRILAWEIPWTEEPGGLQSLGSQKSQTQLSMHAQGGILAPKRKRHGAFEHISCDQGPNTASPSISIISWTHQGSYNDEGL